MVDHDRNNGHRSPERLEDELRQTRRAMDETLDELSAHLEPRRMVNEAWHTIREHLPSGERASHVAKEAGRDLTRRIGAHPIPAAIIGAGVVWLIIEEAMGESVRGEHAARAADAARDKAHDVADRVGEHASRMGDKASGLASRAGEKAHDAAHRIGDTAHDMAEGMHRRAHTASEHVSRAASRAASAAADGARHTADATADAYESRPLLFGALAIAAGLAAGIAAPKTRAERRVLGKAGEDLRHEASDIARRTGHRVMDAAKETATEGVERVADAVESEADRAADKAEGAADKSEGKSDRDAGGSPSTWMPDDAGRPPVETPKQGQPGMRPVNRP